MECYLCVPLMCFQKIFFKNVNSDKHRCHGIKEDLQVLEHLLSLYNISHDSLINVLDTVLVISVSANVLTDGNDKATTVKFLTSKDWYFPPYCAEARISWRWRHNELIGISNHQPHDYLLNRLLGHRSKKTSPGMVNSPHKWPVTRKRFPLDDIIMFQEN